MMGWMLKFKEDRVINIHNVDGKNRGRIWKPAHEWLFRTNSSLNLEQLEEVVEAMKHLQTEDNIERLEG